MNPRALQLSTGFNRRSMLHIGALAAMGTTGGWTLPSLLRAEEAAGIKKNPKSVIMIYLVGGPRIKTCST